MMNVIVTLGAVVSTAIFSASSRLSALSEDPSASFAVCEGGLAIDPIPEKFQSLP